MAKKRQIKRPESCRPQDRIVVAPVSGRLLLCEGAKSGDFAILKLNFETSELTLGRLVAVRNGRDFKLESYSEDLNASEIEALVLRIDRVVWEFGIECDEDEWPEIIGD